MPIPRRTDEVYFCHSCNKMGNDQPLREGGADCGKCTLCKGDCIEMIESDEQFEDLIREHPPPSTATQTQATGHVAAPKVIVSIREFQPDGSYSETVATAATGSADLAQSIVSTMESAIGGPVEVQRRAGRRPRNNDGPRAHGADIPGTQQRHFGETRGGGGGFFFSNDMSLLSILQNAHRMIPGGFSFGEDGSFDFNNNFSIQNILHEILMAHEPTSVPTPQSVIDGLMSFKHVTPEMTAKHPHLTDPCCVCQEAFAERGNEWILVLPCSHCFHKKCLLPWLKQSQVCPVCRANIVTGTN